jgi:hypothetical protein
MKKCFRRDSQTGSSSRRCGRLLSGCHRQNGLAGFEDETAVVRLRSSEPRDVVHDGASPGAIAPMPGAKNEHFRGQATMWTKPKFCRAC